MTSVEKQSPCKVNLLLNVLGKRPDGFHELETVMHPVGLFDIINIGRKGPGIELTCTEVALPTDGRNLVYRAAEVFIEKAGIKDGVRLHLEKRIPLAAGLGGGSGNAATTLLGLNEIFGNPLTLEELEELAVMLGSDVPFFLQRNPALAIGRGEKIQSLDFFPTLRGTALVLIHPGFGIAASWAYQNLARFSSALNGQRGRAQKLIDLLQGDNLAVAAKEFYNSLEAPALEKYPLLVLFQDFLRGNGAAATLMSGSGSTTFAIAQSPGAAADLAEKVKGKFGETTWVSVVPL